MPENRYIATDINGLLHLLSFFLKTEVLLNFVIMLTYFVGIFTLVFSYWFISNQLTM